MQKTLSTDIASDSDDEIDSEGKLSSAVPSQRPRSKRVNKNYAMHLDGGEDLGRNEETEGSNEEEEDGEDSGVPSPNSHHKPSAASRLSATEANRLPDSIFAAAKAAKDALDTKAAAKEERKQRRTLESKTKKPARGGKVKSKGKSVKDVVVG